MRICRSCSPKPRRNAASCKTNCTKPFSLPRRRCQSLSPRRSAVKLCERSYCKTPCNPCESLSLTDCCRYSPVCSPRIRKYRPRICSPCLPRGCCFTDRCPFDRKSCLSRRCDTSSYCKYLPSERCDPCKYNSCYQRTCDPCAPRRESYCVKKFEFCDSCFTRGFSRSYRWKCDSCLSREIPKCDIRNPLKYDTCYISRREPCLRRTYCDPCSPCSSPLCSLCSSRCPDMYSKIKIRDLPCDTFRKVCYPKELPIQSCTIKSCACDRCILTCPSTKDPACEVTKVDSGRCDVDDAPSWNFLQKSRRLGKCMDRYDPHLCPWEANVSISGTVRGHCTSTAEEVARRMSGRFRAEGERFTTDSCEIESKCLPDCQRMNLGKLDDGTMLNFSRNNEPSEKETRNSSHNRPTCKYVSQTELRNNRCRRSRDPENDRKDHSSHYSCLCRESCDCCLRKGRQPLLSCDERGSLDDTSTNQNSYSNRRSSHQNVKFESDGVETDYKSASEMKSLSSKESDTTFQEVQSFLDDRRRRRQRSRANSPVKVMSKEKIKQSPVDEEHNRNSCRSVTPVSHLFRQSKTYNDPAEESPLFIPSTHRSPVGDKELSDSRYKDNLDNVRLYSSQGKDTPQARKRQTEYCEISLEKNNPTRNRHIRNYRNHHARGSFLSDENNGEY